MRQSNRAPSILRKDLEKLRNSKILSLAIKSKINLNNEDLERISSLENLNLVIDAIYEADKSISLRKEIFLDELLNNIRLINKVLSIMPNAIIFDCDGTLVQTEVINKLTFKEILKPNKEKLTPEEIQDIYQNQVLYSIENIEENKEIHEIFEEVFQQEIQNNKQEYEINPYNVISQVLIDEENQIIEEKKVLFVALLLSSLIKGLTFNTAFNTILTPRIPGQFRDIQDFRQIFRSHNKEIKETLGVESTLGTKEFLEENQTPYMVASNSPNFVIQENTQELNIPEEKILSSHDLDKKRGKPHPDVFLLALKKLQSNPRQTIIIEDSKPGVLAALSAGICLTFTNQIVTKLNSFTQSMQFSEKQKIENKIMEIITDEIYIDKINETLERHMFGYIYILGQECIETGIAKAYQNLLKSQILEELVDAINEIIIDSTPEIESRLLTKDTLEMFLNYITENTVKDLPQIIIFNNGDNQALCSHQSFFSISDMQDLNFLLNQ